MMKNISKILAIMFFAMVIGISAKAQVTATSDPVSATATIVTPISIDVDADMAFGTLVPDLDGGTVTISPVTDLRSFGLGITGITSTVSSAHFSVAGTPDQAYSIDLPADGAVTLIGAGDPMPLSAWTTDLGGLSGTLDGTGNQSFKVGATLTIGAGQISGPYTGTFDVTVTYE